ncbi:MAG: hypothetical protein V1736_13770, partial [Pseudomonadota bacterium]
RGGIVRRDHTATVVSIGQGMQRRLLVNGISITYLTPITKVMAHLPLAYCEGKPQSALVICLGMGTTYRSLLSWDVNTTAAELVPSVKNALGYYVDDAESLSRNPKGRIVIDDGRRFLNRTAERFDVITVDPPPPVEAAGSSLLYSEEFYRVAKARLNKGGIFHQWFPGGEPKIMQAIARSLSNSFPYVRAYVSLEDCGLHFIASTRPLAAMTPGVMISRMPDKAKRDILEWSQGRDLNDFVKDILRREVPFSGLLSNDKAITISDDRPYNEYYVLRRIRG